MKLFHKYIPHFRVRHPEDNNNSPLDKSIGDARANLIPKPGKKPLLNVGSTNNRLLRPAVAAGIRDLKTKQEEIMDMLKSIAPVTSPNEKARALTDKLTNVLNQATISPVIKGAYHNKHRAIGGQNSYLARKHSLTQPISQPTQSGVMRKLLKPYLDNEKNSNNNNQLDKEQIEDLLRLTKIAELTAIKKQDVTHPTQTKNTSAFVKKDLHTRVRALLKKPRVRTLLHFLIQSRKSKNLLKFLRNSYDEALGKTSDSAKRDELTDKYNKALRRLLELWSKRVTPGDNKRSTSEKPEVTRRSNTPKSRVVLANSSLLRSFG